MFEGRAVHGSTAQLQFSQRCPSSFDRTASSMTVPTYSPKSTTGSVHYVQQPLPGEELYAYVYVQPPEGKEPSNARRIDHKIQVEDLRSKARELTLEENGVELHKLDSPEGIDWQNDAEVLYT